MRMRTISIIITIIGVLAISMWLGRETIATGLFNLTGEEQLLGQVRGLLEVSTQFLRPIPNTAPDAVAALADVPPYGVNTFLQQEVEPAKRDRQVRLASEAGFKWMRQQFPWFDVEIHAKGDFSDCRHGACIDAWAKYDNIVEIAEKYGMQLIVRLDAPPGWAQDPPGGFAPPANFDDFADYVVAVVERYQGRVRFYQIWNEPNNYPEWGEQPVDPESFTRLLCTTYERIKQVDEDAVVIAPALTPTISLNAGPGPGSGLNEFIFLQRMYDAGAGDCFDVMSAQGYGLFSGPSDHRLRPRVVNFARPLYIRDIMIVNGDASKPIWISEMNWNAVPDEIPDKRFGQVTLEQQARYLPLAFERIEKEWPWIGVANVWYLKDADESDRNQTKYFFRLLDPDFSPLPVYEAMKAYTSAASEQ